YPAGLSVGQSGGEERVLVACNNSDEAVLLNTGDGKVIHRFDLSTMKRIPASPLAGGSHPTALLLNRDNSRLFVALTNRDEIAEVDAGSGKIVSYLSTKLPGQKYGGSDPEYLALSADEKTL